MTAAILKYVIFICLFLKDIILHAQQSSFVSLQNDKFHFL